ncbi:MAG TPA: FAD-dependent oxidoreductase, partial [Limnochordales bacterium]
MSTPATRPARKPQYQRVPIPHRPVAERVRDFSEVAITYTDADAVVEAQRCLQCYRPACEEACPNHNPIKAFLRLVAEGRPEQAAQLLWPHNPLPACTGRVCAWERQCEGACPLARKGQAVAIGALERYLAEKGLAHLGLDSQDAAGSLAGPWPSGRQAIPRGDVAVVGAGPAGLACASTVALAGLRPVVLDSWVAPGGVMSYGIPEFVLPKAVLAQEIRRLQRLGVQFVQQVRVGRDITLEELLAMGFRAVFVAVGANEPARAGVPGEDLQGVVSARDFLAEVALGRLRSGPQDGRASHPPGRPLDGLRVVVIGAGNTAMD